jgi:hypothetical protein
VKPSEIREGGVYARQGKYGWNLRRVVSIGKPAPFWARSCVGRDDAVAYLEITQRKSGSPYITSAPSYTLPAFARWAQEEGVSVG